MILRQNREFPTGFTSITEVDGAHTWVMQEGQTFWPDRPMSNGEAGGDA